MILGFQTRQPIETISVKVEWDAEARVWYTAETSIRGLNLEAETLDGLLEKLPAAIVDLLQETEQVDQGAERVVNFELIVPRTAEIRAR
jgi:hypothetical protein